jgi:signal transduction histidine kinase
MSEGRNLRSSFWVGVSRRVVLGFAVAIATLVLVFAVTLNALSRRSFNGQSVSRSFAILNQTHKLLAEIDSSKLALADFLLTGDKKLLGPYQAARRTIPGTLDELSTLTAGRASAQRQLEQLRPVLMRAIELDAREAAERESGASPEQLRPLIIQGKATLAEASSLLDQVKADTRQILETEQVALADSIRASSFIVIFGDVVLFALILAAAYVTLRDGAEKARTVLFQRRMLGMVSHDLRNPLSVVMMSATQLGMMHDANDRRQNAVGRILAATYRMEKMIRDLLDYSRIELEMTPPLKIQPSDIHSSFEHVLDEFRTVHPTREICYEPGSGDPDVSWDADRMERVIENLVSNALKYSPDNTAVRVAWRRDAHGVVLEVSNGGAPIPDAELPHIFEPFHRGADQDAGTSRQSHGLGLYIVLHIVRQHGGDIDVKSSATAGTTFTVAVPQPVPTSVAA